MEGRMFRRREMVLLFAFVSFAVLLWFGFSVKPVYADNGVGINSVTPGEGGDLNPLPKKVEGVVLNRRTGAWATSLRVYLTYGYTEVLNYTNAYGQFEFEGSFVVPGGLYKLSVNGDPTGLFGGPLGYIVDDIHWGQWNQSIVTDSTYGYARAVILLEPAAVVKVPAAAMFSNTKYATLKYGLVQTSSFAHILSFSVGNSGVSTSYVTGQEAAWAFSMDPTCSKYVARPYYAVTYFDATTGHVVSSGISAEYPSELWSTHPTTEYLNPNSLNEGTYMNFGVDEGSAIAWQYTETGSCTWRESAGVPFAVSYGAFGLSINLDVTVTNTQGIVNYVSFDVHVPLGDGFIRFRAYTNGAFVDPKVRPQMGAGGMELHVWNLNGTG